MTASPLDLRGVFTALVTPFTKDGISVDTRSLEKLIDFQLGAGVQGFVACGSTGEAATLSPDEYVQVVRTVRERTRGVCPCIAGISVSSTATAVATAMLVAELGCDGILVAAPPYNKPSQDGLLEHFRAIHRAVPSMPIVAYNIPGRSGVGFTPATLAALAKEKLIVGIKESSGSVDLVADTMSLLPTSVQMLSGEDSLTLAVLAYGGTGVISASANALPKEFVDLATSYLDGRVDEARRIQISILPKIRALFVESNPVPVKTVLALKGLIAEPTVRLPLVPLSAPSREVIKREFLL